MQLILPSLEYKASFIQAVQEYQAEQSDDRKDIYALKVEDLNRDFNGYLASLISESAGENLPDGYVPQTTYWLVDNGEFIGRVSLRHRLSEYLLKEGGHIGYDIRPTKRKHGYGKKILELALPRARQLGISEILVTCNETNIGSRKIIEANKGVLENVIEVGADKPRKMRYWIK